MAVWVVSFQEAGIVIDEGYCFQYAVDNRKDCPCGNLNHRCEVKQAKAPHYAELRCRLCGRHHGFIPSPTATKNRPKAHRDIVKKSGITFCQMCLRKESELVHPDHLTAHHVDEFAEGGSSDLSNQWIVCNGCHKLIHWTRTYLNRQLGGEE